MDAQKWRNMHKVGSESDEHQTFINGVGVDLHE